MRLLEKDRGNKDPDLEAYLYFLEEIEAFESKNVEPVFFHEEFEL